MSAKRLTLTAALAACAALATVQVASAVVVLSDDFNSVASSSNYNVFITPGATGPSGDATFGYDYGAAPGSGGLSIPLAPNTTDGSKLGLRVRTDNLQSSVGTVVGASSVVTKNLSLGAAYKVTVDVWSNYIGGTTIASSGTNGTTGTAIGVGSAGTSLQYIAGNDGLLVEGFGDNGGGANQAYRVYTDNVHPNPTTKTYWPAGTSGTSASFSDPYYTSTFLSVAAPAGQSSFATSQTGSSAAGTLGFAWHTWTIFNDASKVTWAIDGKPIAIIPVADFIAAGSQVSLGNDDTGLTGSSVANNQLFNAQIFDNIVVESLPEANAWMFGAVACSAAGMVYGGRARRLRKGGMAGRAAGDAVSG